MNQNDVVVSESAGSDPDHAQKVRELLAAGWSTHQNPSDVERVARMGTLDQVRSAIARASELSRRKTLRGTFRGCIVKELERGGYGLFEDKGEAQRRERAGGRRMQDLCNRYRHEHGEMPEIFRSVTAAADHLWNHLQIGTALWRKFSAAGALTEADLAKPDDELWAHLMNACGDLAAHHHAGASRRS